MTSGGMETVESRVEDPSQEVGGPAYAENEEEEEEKLAATVVHH